MRAADTLAQLCGYLPLALRLAASALAGRVTLSVSAYIERLKDAQKRLELVDASLSLSYDLLTPEQQRLWRTLAVFPAAFDLPAAAAVWDIAPDAAADALDELVRYSLVELASPLLAGEGPGVRSEEGAGRFSLHDLARVFAGARSSRDERAAAQRRHAAHYESVLRTANDLYEQGGDNILRGLALFDLEWPNIQAGHAWAVANARTDTNAIRLCNNYADNWYILDLRLHPREYIRWLEAALTAARQLKNRMMEGVHLGNLGLAYADLGDARQAIQFYEQAREIEIGDRRAEGALLGNLGNAYAALGDARRAIQFYEQALAIDREIGDRRGEGTALWNMALSLDELGDREQAIACAKAALKIYEQIESPYADRVRQQLAAWRNH